MLSNESAGKGPFQVIGAAGAVKVYRFAAWGKNTPKDKTGNCDCSNGPTLDAKSVYEHFFKLDYQARKLRAFLVQDYDLHVE